MKYDSLESQEDVLRRHVGELPGIVPEIYKVYRDTESGTKLEQRSGLIALLADAEAGLFDEAVAYNLDRWHRSIEIFALMKSVTRRCGVRFTSSTQQFEDDAEGELMETQLAAFSQYFSRLVGKKVSIKRQARFALGKWNGGCRPYGYTSEAADLKPLPVEAPILRQIFAMFMAHPSYASIRNRLKALGIHDRRGMVWSAKTLEWIIRNPIYTGLVHERGKLRDGIHEALVPREMWEAAQRLLPTKTRLVESKKYKRIYPLRGLIFCGHCRVAMKAHRATGRGGRLYPRYRCEQTFARAWADCPVKEIRAEAIEEWVAQQLTKITADEALLESAIAAANASASAAAKPLVERRTAVEERLAEVRAKEANLASAIASGGSFEALKGALASEQAARHLLETERDALKRQIDALAGDPIDPARVRRLLGDFRLLYEAATDEERADLLGLLIARIDFHGKNANVVVTFRDDVKLTAPVRSYAVKWLPELGSNQRPTD